MSKVQCPACGHESEKCYRCTACGHDLAKTDASNASRSNSTHGGN